jgi:hypothetical protein
MLKLDVPALGGIPVFLDPRPDVGVGHLIRTSLSVKLSRVVACASKLSLRCEVALPLPWMMITRRPGSRSEAGNGAV